MKFAAFANTCIVASLLTLLLVGTSEAQRYTITDLGTLGGDSSWATAINDAGQVVGYSAISGQLPLHAFVWTQSGGMQDLTPRFDNIKSFALAINAAGNVVGGADLKSTEQEDSLLWTQSGRVLSLGTLGGTLSVALAVNTRDWSSLYSGAHFQAACFFGSVWPCTSVRCIPLALEP